MDLRNPRSIKRNGIRGYSLDYVIQFGFSDSYNRALLRTQPAVHAISSGLYQYSCHKKDIPGTYVMSDALALFVSLIFDDNRCTSQI